MGVTASCRNGAGYESDQGATLPEEPTMSTDDILETVLCREDELTDEGLKSFEVDGGKILVVNENGKLSALGSKCPHAGAPLENGALCNGRIRCPWHGACFNIETGDIEDYPGLDSIPKYDIDIEDGYVKVRASRALLVANKRTKPMASRDPENSMTFVIVGGGAAGATCVEKLRQEGFTGRVVLVGREDHLPYNRPNLSKAMDLTSDQVTLRSHQFYESGDIELRLGTAAVRVDTEETKVHLSNNEELSYDKLFIATGGRPRRPDIPGSELDGVFVIRTPEDANAAAAAAAGKNVVVVGTSFIGMEAASYLANRAASVTVVGNTAVPYQNTLGKVVGGCIQKLFEENGVSFLNEASVQEFLGEDGNLTQVSISNNDPVEAEVVILGVGVIPETDFLSTSDIVLDERGYVIVNEFLATSDPNIFCGGDIASFPLFLHDGELVSIGHWQMAHKHGATAALNMLGQNVPIRSVPFFWTVVFGKSLRYTGHGSFDDVIISGDLDSLSFIAYYCQGDRVVGLASLMKDPAAARYAEKLQQGEFLTKADVLEDGDIALKL